MNFNVYFWQGAQYTTWYRQHLFQKLFESLKQRYPDHSFTPLDDKNGNIYSKFSPHMFTVECVETGKYSIVSLNDRNIWVFNKLFGWQPKKMQQFICSSGFNYEFYEDFKKSRPDCEWEYPDDIKLVHFPFTYDVYNTAFVRDIENIINTPSSLNKNIVFRGFLYLEREWLASNLNFNNISIISNRLTFDEYVKEMHNEICSLSLNGAGEICNRDIELFGLGKIVIRTKLNCNFHNPLIPDVHYASICPDTKFDDGITRVKYEDLRNSIIDKYNDIVNNYDKYKHIGENARKWYLENCTLDSQVRIFNEIFDINKLVT